LSAPLHLAALSLGSNQQPQRHLRAAIDALHARFPGATISPAYRFPAVGFDGPEFINAAALIHTDLDAHTLTAWLRALEAQHGRERGGPRYGNRTLDIDIVLFDDAIINEPGGMQIPRAELRHAFVLKPLADIAPDLLHPQLGCSIGALWAAHPQHARAFQPVPLPPADTPPAPGADSGRTTCRLMPMR